MEWQRSVLGLAKNNDPLRSSISIIVTIMTSIPINCVHCAVTVLHMHEYGAGFEYTRGTYETTEFRSLFDAG